MSTNNQSLKIVVAETSIIIRSGVSAVLKRIPNLDIHPIEVNSVEALSHYAHLHQPDMVIINPSFDGWFNLPAFKAEHPRLTGVKYIALISSVTHNNVLKEYDERFSICDDLDIIAAKLNGLLRGDEEEEEEKDNESDTLSQREKEIVTCVVKGMTNKAIADKLFLSIHTVITHRRNIARKLQIHSPAGLTIYAIVNKLVELSDIKEKL
ncbi:response regulator transcription factor [Mediterranea massiliensis]|uniref:response regulator transcription factor n=1 Tax=Mediterranea massiliensis TaxID=1841865 RepID=UPI00266D6C59|nr:response regulator transcription factor [Mediterranea massiliensis]